METHRINFTVSPKTYRILKKLADKRGTTISNILRDAIVLEDWFEDTTEEGGKVLVERDGKAREIVRRYP